VTVVYFQLDPNREALRMEGDVVLKRLTDGILEGDDGSLAAAYVFVRRVLVKAEMVVNGPFGVRTCMAVARSALPHLQDFTALHPDDEEIPTLIAALNAALQAREVETNEATRAQRQRSTRRDTETVRQQRGLRRQSS